MNTHCTGIIIQTTCTGALYVCSATEMCRLYCWSIPRYVSEILGKPPCLTWSPWPSHEDQTWDAAGGSPCAIKLTGDSRTADKHYTCNYQIRLSIAIKSRVRPRAHNSADCGPALWKNAPCTLTLDVDHTQRFIAIHQKLWNKLALQPFKTDNHAITHVSH